MDALVKINTKTETKTEHCESHGDFESMALMMLGKICRWTICPECSKENEAVKEAQKVIDEANERQIRMESKINRAGVPIRFRKKTFGSYVAGTPGQDHALAVATEFAENFDNHLANGTVIVFSGMPGTGKSHLAIAAAIEIMKHRSALYISAIDAVRMIRDTWKRDSEKTETQVLDELSSVDLLILDEVGVQYGTEAEQVSLFDIIDKRYRDQMPMILLTNQNKFGLKSFLGDRSFDRLREGGIWVTFDWESQRGNVNKSFAP